MHLDSVHVVLTRGPTSGVSSLAGGPTPAGPETRA
jgi:hypothetical protein